MFTSRFPRQLCLRSDLHSGRPSAGHSGWGWSDLHVLACNFQLGIGGKQRTISVPGKDTRAEHPLSPTTSLHICVNFYPFQALFQASCHVILSEAFGKAGGDSLPLFLLGKPRLALADVAQLIVIPCTERLPVQFPVRAHTQVLSLVRVCVEGNHLLFLSHIEVPLSLYLPSSLFKTINENIKKSIKAQRDEMTCSCLAGPGLEP